MPRAHAPVVDRRGLWQLWGSRSRVPIASLRPTARDSGGATTTVTRDLQPETVNPRSQPIQLGCNSRPATARDRTVHPHGDRRVDDERERAGLAGARNYLVRLVRGPTAVPSATTSSRPRRRRPTPPRTTGTGTVHYVSDLPFTLETNGWGPVERDRSNGEMGAADGAPTTRGHDLYRPVGVHAASGVRLAIARLHCSRRPLASMTRSAPMARSRSACWAAAPCSPAPAS